MKRIAIGLFCDAVLFVYCIVALVLGFLVPLLLFCIIVALIHWWAVLTIPFFLFGPSIIFDEIEEKFPMTWVSNNSLFLLANEQTN